MPGRAVLPFRTHIMEWASMERVEYKSAPSPWLREILYGAAASVISNLVWEALAVAARHLI